MGQLDAGGMGRIFLCGLECPHMCIQGLLQWGMKNESEWASVQEPPSLYHLVPTENSESLRTKFQPGLPHSYEVRFVKVGG